MDASSAPVSSGATGRWTIGEISSLEVGDFVLAIGSPFGLGRAVTSGIISALGRTGLGIEGYEDIIQTDASINPGNSGGAVVTLDGRLVRVNTAILSKTGASNGVGFAIPIDMARKAMQQIVAHGEVQSGRIGVSLHEPSGFKRRKGAEIASVEPAPPAERAGLAKGIAVDGKPIENPGQLRNLVGLIPIGREIDLRYIRADETDNAVVRVEAQHGASRMR